MPSHASPSLPTRRSKYCPSDCQHRDTPRGQELVVLLQASRKSMMLNSCRHGDIRAKRPRAPSVYELVKNKSIETVDALQAFAEEAQAIRPALAEYCIRQGHKLDDQLTNAWAVVGAPKRLATQCQSHVISWRSKEVCLEGVAKKKKRAKRR